MRRNVNLCGRGRIGKIRMDQRCCVKLTGPLVCFFRGGEFRQPLAIRVAFGTRERKITDLGRGTRDLRAQPDRIAAPLRHEILQWLLRWLFIGISVEVRPRQHDGQHFAVAGAVPGTIEIDT